MNQFLNNVEEYKAIAKKDRREADDFYIVELLPEIARKAADKRKESLPHATEYDLLISMQGFSIGPSVIASLCLKPKSICLLYSIETKSKVDEMHEILYKLLGMKPTDIYRTVCKPTSATDIYSKIKNILNEFKEDQGIDTKEDIRVAIDVTGGKKVMSASGALAAWRENIDICYVESEPSSEVIGRPEPGSEHLIMLGNPLNIFREPEMHDAIEIFNRGYYTNAIERFGRLEKALWKPAVARIMCKLAQLYRAWTVFDYTTTRKLIKWFDNNEANFLEYKPYLNLDEMNRINDRVKYLKLLTSDSDNHLYKLLTCHCIGCFYMRINRYEFAATMFYRVIEGCLTQRLVSEYAVGSQINPDYTSIKSLHADVNEKYKAIMKELSFRKKHKYIDYEQLPPWLGFVSSVALLLIMQDDYLLGMGFSGIEGLEGLEKISSIRNNSIIAHGYDILSENSAETVKEISFRFITELWKSGDFDMSISNAEHTIECLSNLRIR